MEKNYLGDAKEAKIYSFSDFKKKLENEFPKSSEEDTGEVTHKSPKNTNSNSSLYWAMASGITAVSLMLYSFNNKS